MTKPTAQHIGVKDPGVRQPYLDEIASRAEDLLFLDHPDYQISLNAWNKYNNKIRSNRKVTDEYFEFCSFKIGKISESLANKLLISFDSLPKRIYAKNDCRYTYVTSPISDSEQRAHAKKYLFFNFEEEQFKMVKNVCEELKPTIESCLGTGFKVINVKACETVIGGPSNVGPGKLHIDAFPTFIQKTLVYLTEASMQTGTTQLCEAKTLEHDNKNTYVIGPPGSFVFFNPNTIKHRGIEGEHGRKVILEITVCPSHETEINPTFNGNNSRHPIMP